jgi:hypothetical protein
LGYSYATIDNGRAVGANTSPDLDVQSWMVGFQWSDVFVKGNSAGFAFGQAPFTNDQRGTARNQNQSDSYLWELFYKYQVSDNISVTPAIFYSTGYQRNNYQDTWGAVIQTTFRF